MHDGEVQDGKLNDDGVDNYEVNVCVMNEGDMVGSVSEDDSDDAIFYYDNALGIAFDDYGANDNFIEEEMDNLFDYITML